VDAKALPASASAYATLMQS